MYNAASKIASFAGHVKHYRYQTDKSSASDWMLMILKRNSKDGLDSLVLRQMHCDLGYNINLELQLN